ncbi:hypothetical protein EYV94_18085 [Puteibacter caeruleilacunae]|nr:hypothetical protein EYV94_18085 [Puteibacter caeruleilacunae]
MNRYLYFIIIALFPMLLQASVSVPPIFSSDMVMQRNESVKIWGKGNPGTTVELVPSWNKTVKVKVDKEGKWSTFLKTDNNQASHSLVIKDFESEIVLSDIWFGEVWLCGGQSNMAWKVVQPIKDVREVPCIEADDMIEQSVKHKIRFFTTDRKGSKEPADEVGGAWVRADKETTKQCSAVAYSFAEKLSNELNVPVGIVVSAVGGSKVEAWLDKETYDQFEPIPDITDKTPSNKVPCLLYNAMINPLKGFTVKGFIYYQGEANRHDPSRYAKTFPALIKLWRKQWEANLPFYFAQLAPYEYKEGDSYLIREVQLETASKLKDTGVAITMDVGEEKSIHPRHKRPVGKRLALQALANTYGHKDIVGASPVVKSCKAKNGKVYVTFDQNITVKDGELLELAGDNNEFKSARIESAQGNQIVLSCDDVKQPSVLQYGYKNWAKASLFGPTSLPVSSFRRTIK